VSPGCDNCYAERIATRFKKDFSKVELHPERLKIPISWKSPSRIFVNSVSDLFHPEVPFEFVQQVFDIASACERHIFQVLTKRPSRMKHFNGVWPQNVWAGTSIENAEYKWRIDQLRLVPASIRFLSIEPLIGPVGKLDLDGIDWVIVGGESGPGHRPLSEDWVTEIKLQCDAGGVAFFFKQWGGHTSKAGGRELDGRVWNAMPEGIMTSNAI
jgi:protein gp37